VNANPKEINVDLTPIKGNAMQGIR
jgi:hypothetical protein